MSVHCTRCGHPNMSMARYCARCGRGLASQAIASGSTGLLPLLILMGVGFFWLAGPVGSFIGRSPRCRTPYPASRIDRHYNLPDAKADALFTLLAPNHVRVQVSREHQGLAIRGTPDQVDVLDQFVDLVTRFHGFEAQDLHQTMTHLQPTWQVRRDYRLRESQARYLYKILAFNDVPVLVEQNTAGVSIDANAEDQHTLSQLVAILNGRF